MITKRLRKCLKKDLPTTTISMQIPVDVLDSLKAIAPTRGFNAYKTLLKSYISDGLRRDEAQNPHVGSSFDDFLKEEGIFEETRNAAIRHVLASQIAEIMKTKKLTKSQMASWVRVSGDQLDRLLDPDDANVTIATLQRVAVVLRRKLLLDLV
jgi:antitoxin HicB